jgi:hypothetical protein
MVGGQLLSRRIRPFPGRPAPQKPREVVYEMTIAFQPLIALVAGILILLIPRLLNYIVAVYLIVIGL